MPTDNRVIKLTQAHLADLKELVQRGQADIGYYLKAGSPVSEGISPEEVQRLHAASPGIKAILDRIDTTDPIARFSVTDQQLADLKSLVNWGADDLMLYLKSGDVWADDVSNDEIDRLKMLHSVAPDIINMVDPADDMAVAPGL